MYLIADAGSTKTEWSYNGRTFFSQGINPIQQSEENVLAEFLRIRDVELANMAEDDCGKSEGQSLSVRFYGAGCTVEKSVIVKRLLEEVFPNADVEVNSDLLAAAHALCGHDRGVACILGTGSNSCLYDGEKIVQNTPALGYILGDEGSGAVLGRLFLNALLKGRIEDEVCEAFQEEYHLTIADIIDKVYRQPLANRYLASLSTFIGKHKEKASVHSIIRSNFLAFLDNNVKPYHYEELSFTGSIAYFYADILKNAASERGYIIKKITKSPMEGLLEFYKLT